MWMTVKNTVVFTRSGNDFHNDRFLPPMTKLIGKRINVISLGHCWYLHKSTNTFYHKSWLKMKKIRGMRIISSSCTKNPGDYP